MTKSPSFAQLDGLQVDVAIIGAGINGASAAQHLSAAGYRVLVVDQGDFANGASSRSSRLLHCGLRHLAASRATAAYTGHRARRYAGA
jgi:glycerol-3-phosphate dehydrogenase